MKWLRTMVLFDQGNVISSADWKSLHESYVRAIASIEHPRSSGSLTLRRKVRLPNNQWKRNGVGYLRKEFLAFMRDHEGGRQKVTSRCPRIGSSLRCCSILLWKNAASQLHRTWVASTLWRRLQTVHALPSNGKRAISPHLIGA